MQLYRTFIVYRQCFLIPTKHYNDAHLSLGLDQTFFSLLQNLNYKRVNVRIKRRHMDYWDLIE
jgi:hypothetical protein